MPWPPSATAETLDYSVRWTDVPAGDSVATVTAVLPTGLALVSIGTVSGVTTLWISALNATAGQRYRVAFTVTTTLGRVYHPSTVLEIRDRVL
jgi:hypothetical protein